MSVGGRLNQPGNPAREVRTEDAFDVAAADRWIKERVPDLTGIPQVKQYAGGASNLTYLLSYSERDVVLRRPPAGHKAASAHDMHREFRVQHQLKPVYPYVPEVLAFCDDHSVIGSDFYVMEHLTGFIPRKELPAAVRGDLYATRALALSVVDRLVDLHSVDPANAGLADLGRGPGYVQRQVDGWSRRYRAARTRNVPSFERVMSWLAANQPPDVSMCLIHNDFRLDNVVLSEDATLRVLGVLDWEMATVGDPLMDLGSAMAYWVQADDDWVFKKFRRQPTNEPGMPTRAEVVRHYTHARGLSADAWAFYEVFGLFRLAAIVQQIYFRYSRKETTNPAFKNYWLMAGYLNLRCHQIIRKS